MSVLTYRLIGDDGDSVEGLKLLLTITTVMNRLTLLTMTESLGRFGTDVDLIIDDYDFIRGFDEL